ncbi:MAG: two-component system sensor histidine kinase HydH [Myxococcota bacterium]|jgi:two-component system sensor histidine kinase HydH
MDPWIRIQSALLAAIISSALAINILLRNRRNRLYLLYSYFNFNLVAWYVSDALYVYGDGGSDLLLKLRTLVAIGIPINAARFFRAFVADKSRLSFGITRLFVALSIGFAGLIVFDFYKETDLVFRGVYGYIFIALYISLYFIYRRYERLESNVERTRLRYLMVSGAVAFTLAMLDYMPGIGYYFFGNILTVIFLYFLFQIILKFRVLDLYEFLGRAIVMATFSFVVASIYVGLVVWWRKEVDLFIFNTLIASIVLFILYDPLRHMVEDKMNQLLFRERYEFARHLQILRRQMANVIHVDVLVDLVLRRIETSRRATHASVYLLEDYGMGFAVKGHFGPHPVRRLDRVTHHPFFKRLKEQPVLIVENLERERRQLEEYGLLAGPGVVEELDSVLGTLEELHSGVCLGFMADGQIMGFINLKDDRLREAYSSEEIRLLMAVSAQMTLTFENSRLFERVRERDRLAALGEMAAGLAHEIRNPLGAIKGAAQLIDGTEKEADPEMLRIIVEETNRLNKVVASFLDYARPTRKPSLTTTDLNRVVESTADIIKAGNEYESTITVSLDRNLPEIQSEPEQLKQVFINLAQNALQAMGDGGELTISTRLTTGRPTNPGVRRERGFVRIGFTDTGPGIPEEVLRNIFIPFYTTKDRGTGLGLAVSLRIMKNLGGTIEVSSLVGHGTTFSVLVPVS